MKRALVLGSVIAIAACGGGQTPLNLFSTNWTDDGGRSIEQVRLKLAGARPAPGTDVAIGVGGNSDKLIGVPLSGGGAKWTVAHPLDARPVIAGNVVVASGGGELFALDAVTGKRLWARPTGGLKVRGAGDDGSVTVISMASAMGDGSTLLAVQRDGSVVRQLETEKLIGTPAVVGGYAFIPWNNVYVSAIDLANGNEAGRVVLREKTSRAWTQGGGLYFGEIGIFRFDAHIKDADKNQASHVTIPVRELPGTPKLMEPGTTNLGPAAGALDRIRVYARPSGGLEGQLTIDDDRYYATYFRLAMAFQAKSGALAWVHTHTSDLLGGAAGDGTISLCDEQGRVTMLDAETGGEVGAVDLGEPLKSCTVQVDALKPPHAPSKVGPLADQLSEALLNREAQLATAKRLLLRELAALTDETATRTLVALASNPRTSPLLMPDARSALANRRNGAQYMIEALRRHYDYLKDVLRPPPVGPMAQALAAMKRTDAAPLLASHLLDPADTDDDVRRAADALVVLASPNEAPQLKQFLGMYRANASEDPVEAAVVAAGQALARVGGADGRATVSAAATDAFTLPGIHDRLQAIMQSVQDTPIQSDADAGAPPAKKKK